MPPDITESTNGKLSSLVVNIQVTPPNTKAVKVSLERSKKIFCNIFTPHFVFIFNFFLCLLLFAPISHVTKLITQRLYSEHIANIQKGLII